MSEVKRYDFQTQGHPDGFVFATMQMQENKGGDYVTYEDFAALQQKLDTAEAKLEAAKSVKENWKNRAWTAEEQLQRYSMEPGRADQYACEAKAVRVELGFAADAVDVAPVDLIERINQQRAEGIIMFASKQLATAGDLDSTITLERLMLDAEEFAGQLRAGKDGE